MLHFLGVDLMCWVVYCVLSSPDYHMLRNTVFALHWCTHTWHASTITTASGIVDTLTFPFAVNIAYLVLLHA
jgi:hypothetical protein